MLLVPCAEATATSALPPPLLAPPERVFKEPSPIMNAPTAPFLPAPLPPFFWRGTCSNAQCRAPCNNHWSINPRRLITLLMVIALLWIVVLANFLLRKIWGTRTVQFRHSLFHVPSERAGRGAFEGLPAHCQSHSSPHIDSLRQSFAFPAKRSSTQSEAFPTRAPHIEFQRRKGSCISGAVERAGGPVSQ